MRWIGSKYDMPAGRLKAPRVRQTPFERHVTRRARDRHLRRFINNRNFALVATGVATAKIATRIKRRDQIKLLILFVNIGGRTRTRTLDPLIKNQRLKMLRIGQPSNKIIQKGLAFLRNQSSTCIQFRALGALLRALGALRDPARRLGSRGGASVVAATDAAQSKRRSRCQRQSRSAGTQHDQIAARRPAATQLT